MPPIPPVPIWKMRSLLFLFVAARTVAGIGGKNACAKCSGGLEEITAGIVLGSGFAHEVTVENARLRIQFDSRRICGKENRYIEFGIIDDIHLVTGPEPLAEPIPRDHPES
jgi:hypothetical protein